MFTILNIRFWIQLSVISVLMAIASPGSAQDEGDSGVRLTVHVKSIRGTAGLLRIAVFDQEGRWLKEGKALKGASRKIGGASLTFVFKGLKPGRYGVSVLHDANENGKMDMRWLPWPKPKEGAGSSRNPKPRAGPPRWKDSVFSLGSEGKTLTITMQYVD